MAVTARAYGRLLEALLNKEVDYMDDSIYAAVLTNAYTPNQDVHKYWSDVVGSELVGTGYTANGIALTNKSMNYDAAANTLTLDCDDLVWSGTTWTNARYLVFYDRTPASDVTRPLLCYTDFGADQSTNGQPFTFVIGTGGFLTLSVA